MGCFARLSHRDGQWREAEPGRESCLSIDVHDSDIATVDYRPAMTGTGRFYLGTEPRHYFEDETASAPIDRRAEAEGFSEWARMVHGREVDPAEVLALMASDTQHDEDDGDAFVEDTVERLLDLIGLPLPEGMLSRG